MEAYVTGTLIIYVVRSLEYRDSIPVMKKEYLLLCSVNTSSGAHPGLFCPVCSTNVSLSPWNEVAVKEV